jgi:superfamily II DNA or RNA helicase
LSTVDLQAREFKPGTILRFRERDWIALPSTQEKLLLLKPLDGREEDICGVYLPLLKEGAVKPSQFYPITEADLGNVRTSRLLFNAARLSLRSAAGPFRSAAKLGFRPRSYQMVPLIMALKQQGELRLLIADDVGVGKTIESILIVKELLERKEIDRFAVICPPHLCEQWHDELKDKFNIESILIKAGTIAGLERKITDDRSIFVHYPFQVISIDFIKSEKYRKQFLDNTPDLVIVDEAHSCARPAGAHTNQQQRHRLIKEIADKPEQRLVLVTATPHSGKEPEFRSILGLLKPEFEEADWESEEKQAIRKKLARYFVQRKRTNIERWMKEVTAFPERKIIDRPYALSIEYQQIYDEVLIFASRLMANQTGTIQQKRFRYWSALALLRGIISSPRAGSLMLEHRAKKASVQDQEISEEESNIENPHYERLENADDELPTPLLETIEWSKTQKEYFSSFAKRLYAFEGNEKDKKIGECIKQIEIWQKQGCNPIVFCRYIETAKYVADCLSAALGAAALVECITSEDPDEVRKARVEAMGTIGKKMRVLVATDCLSEGINLQDFFDAVLHYDLPWNPNRLEQREGRVDRFGQHKKEVQTCLLYCNDNPMDQIVLKVLYNKVKKIRDNIGVSIPFPEDSKVFLDTIFQALLREAEKKRGRSLQQELFSMEDYVKSDMELDNLVKVTERKEKALRSIFAQEGIKAQDIEQDLQVCDEIIGTPETVYSFVNEAFRELFGINVKKNDDELTIQINRSAFPEKLFQYFRNIENKNSEALIAFHAPVPEGHKYWGRNSDAVESICRHALSESLKKNKPGRGAARATVTFSASVKERTVNYMFRARHVIEDIRAGKQLVAEEIILHGLSGSIGSNRTAISKDAINVLMERPAPSGEAPFDIQKKELQMELSVLEAMRQELDTLAYKQAEQLVKQHERYYHVLGTKTTPETKASHFKVVEPVIPMDVLGVYIFMPGVRS